MELGAPVTQTSVCGPFTVNPWYNVRGELYSPAIPVAQFLKISQGIVDWPQILVEFHVDWIAGARVRPAHRANVGFLTFFLL